VALVTQPGLRQAQQALRQPAIFLRDARRPEKLRLSERRFELISADTSSFRKVCRVARLAGNAVKLVLRSIEQYLIMTGDMTRHASRGILVGLAMKSEDERLSCGNLGVVAGGVFNRFNVCLARTMTTLATCAVFRFVRCGFGMNSLEELIALDRMTPHTGILARVLVRLSLSRSFPHN
jgi:hypothetical protein